MKGPGFWPSTTATREDQRAESGIAMPIIDEVTTIASTTTMTRVSGMVSASAPAPATASTRIVSSVA